VKNEIDENASMALACHGVHLGITALLAICLAWYDGLQNTYPIVVGFMFCGWLVPLTSRRYIKHIMQTSTGDFRTDVNKFAPPLTLLILGVAVHLLGVFLPQSLIARIVVDGRTITKVDPRFGHELLKFRAIMGVLGAVSAAGGWLWFGAMKKRK
jgi:hypothetical protein